MLFNSLEFAIFLPIVFLLYWFVFNARLKMQNAFLVLASYFFYGWWDWRFLSLIFFSSLVDYTVGLGLKHKEGKAARKLLLFVSICVNIGFLGFFKYYNFFVDSFVDAFTFLGQPINPGMLSILLPVGISFYTFQTLSYTIDIYRRKLQPTEDVIAFFAFVSFFPQLVAGPIERATNLLPQFLQKRAFDQANAIDGMRQILWGLFKKIVIADNCAGYVNEIFTNYQDQSGSTLFIGAFFFALQIYGDFSGYSDIAIGTARLFGFKLMQNFAFPYFSRDIAEFWRRWHISLTSWFRDYLYIPMGGSRVAKPKVVRNIFIVFIVSGFWHGANWTFIFWGLLHACYFLPLLFLHRNRKNLDVIAKGRYFPNFRELASMIVTFLLVVFAWIFFRAENLSQAFEYVGGLFSMSFFSLPEVLPVELLILILIMFVAEWLQRDKKHALQLDGAGIPGWGRWLIYYAVVFCIIWFRGEQQEFIYFQF
ncbi:MAG: MBOAT family protein [Bacteroidetes bacterium]|nr:MAG: MBOAT family protein [Bacteroidota bacterium]